MRDYVRMSPAEKREYFMRMSGGIWDLIKALPVRFREDGTFFFCCSSVLRYPWQVPCVGFVPGRVGIASEEGMPKGGLGKVMRWKKV